MIIIPNASYNKLPRLLSRGFNEFQGKGFSQNLHKFGLKPIASLSNYPRLKSRGN